MPMPNTCRLCNSGQLTFLAQDNRGRQCRRAFYLCSDCELISVPQEYWLSLKEEKRRYGCHDNYESNAGYCAFLSETASAVATAINSSFPNPDHPGAPTHKPATKLLDFGCGDSAVLGHVLDKTGMTATLGIDYYGYDPFYDHLPLPNADVVGKFDIIVACEVIEHVRDISSELELMDSLLRDGGTIILRTQPYKNPSDFPWWPYASDQTHINFFNRKSLEKAAAVINKRLEKVSGERGDIFFLR